MKRYLLEIKFYDTGQVIGDLGVRLENLTACVLLKEIQFRKDCFGDEMQLHYLQTKDGKEIDFFVSKENSPYLMVEVKWAGNNLSKNFLLFDRYVQGGAEKYKLSNNLNGKRHTQMA